MIPSEKENSLEKEIDAFMEKLPSMLKDHEGKYAVFKGNDRLGFWDSYESALQEGYEKLGLVPSLIRKVNREYEIFGRYGKPLNLYFLSA
ncbi:MAG: hypothetical protein AABW90_04215 [Nanoarchaeota archaeon]